MSAALDLASSALAPQPDARNLVQAALGTLDALGQWLFGTPSAPTQAAPDDGLTRVTTQSRVGPKYRRHGFGAYATKNAEPFMIVWLPPAS